MKESYTDSCLLRKSKYLRFCFFVFFFANYTKNISDTLGKSKLCTPWNPFFHCRHLQATKTLCVQRSLECLEVWILGLKKTLVATLCRQNWMSAPTTLKRRLHFWRNSFLFRASSYKSAVESTIIIGCQKQFSPHSYVKWQFLAQAI